VISTLRNASRLATSMARAATLATLLGGMCLPAHAFLEGFRDPEDGQFDISDWLVNRKGFLPVPIFITEPAVGYGGGVALMFVRNSMRESADRAKDAGQLVPPDIFVATAAATENGTKVAFGGGQMTFGEGRWRYRGGVGRIDVRLHFYGIGGHGIGGDAGSLGYALDGWLSSQRVLRRVGDSDNWVGARWDLMSLNDKVDLSGNAAAGLAPDESTRRTSGLGFLLEHDSRDNIFTPSKGWIGALEATFYDPAWGSDTTFQAYRGRLFGYWPVTKTVVVAGRLDGRVANGHAPFYMLPFIDLRGIPAARYQDERTAVAETEVRWSFTPRWAAIGFIGAGRAWGRDGGFGDAPGVVAKGVGFRYLLSRQLGMWAGLDFANGPEGGAAYIQIGSAWR
jgi:hypothetical protein